MSFFSGLCRKLILLSISFFLLSSCDRQKEVAVELPQVPKFQKIQIDSVFRSESVVAADIDLDGEKDIVIGDVWYEAPEWQMHEIREPGNYLSSVYSEDKPSSEYNYYSDAFASQVGHLNEDSLPDVWVYPVMGQPIYGYINPGNVETHWERRNLADDYHGESPLWVDLVGDGNWGSLVGVKGDEGKYDLSWLGWDSYQRSLQKIIIGESGRSSISWGDDNYFAAGSVGHGLGFGDLNGDGLGDVLSRQGYYLASDSGGERSWDFHYYAFDSLADAEYRQYLFAQMPIFDIDQDGDADFFASSAHRYGLWWFEQVEGEAGIGFIKHKIPYQISQVHAVAMGDLNNNGIPDLVTGKRYLSHNGNDPGWDDPLVLIWMEAYQSKEGETLFHLEEVDEGVGVGTQIVLEDMDEDGKTDILISNKKGTYLFKQA